MTAAIYALASVVVVSALSLAGLATLSMHEARVRRIAELVVSFAVGALLGDAFIHLIPETFATDGGDPPLGASLAILAGMLLFFVVEKVVHHHVHGARADEHHLHHGHTHAQAHAHHDHQNEHEGKRRALVIINVLGDGIHNFIDGVLIGASYLASPTLGLTTTLAVLLHELPQELADFGILVHSGVPVRRAVLLNLASASVAVLGTVIALVVGSVAQHAVTTALIPITAGGFVYLAAADLVPELQRERGVRSLAVQTLLIASGIAVMGALTLVE